MNTKFIVEEVLHMYKKETLELEETNVPEEILSIQLCYRGVDEDTGKIDYVQATKYILKRCDLFYDCSSDMYYIKNRKRNLTKSLGKIEMKKIITHIFEEAAEGYFVPGWSDKILKTMENYVESYSEKPMESAVWSFPNGDFDVETMEFGKPKKSTINYHVMDYDYDAESDCPIFKKAIKEICSGNEAMIQLIQEVTGYCLDKGSAKAQKLIYAWGVGSNGKSLWTEAIRTILPQGMVSSQSLHGMNQRFALSNVSESAVNISPEVSAETILDSSVIKAVTSGNDIVDIEKKYQDKRSGVIKTKFICCSNHFLKSKDTSDGFFRRILVLPFEKRFVSENDPTRTPDCGIIDMTLSQKIFQERAGIFNWAIKGLERLRANNYQFTYYERSEALKKEFMFKSNVVKSFLTDCLIVSKEQRVSSPELHSAFMKWADRKGFETAEYGNKNTFHKHFKDELSKAGIIFEMKKIQGTKFYVGFSLKL